VKFGYGDPPYYGMCGKHYGHRHEAPFGCWDDKETHRQLVGHLTAKYPDGWALSCNSTDLHWLLPLCPPETRIAPWCKSFCAFKKGVRPAYAWEPVLYLGGRNKNHPPPPKGGAQTTPKDYLVTPYLVAPITLKRGLTGAKPEAFCRWVLDLLGYQEGDVMDDLFPGTGVMGQVEAQGVLDLGAS